jgi:hypothetical protein
MELPPKVLLNTGHSFHGMTLENIKCFMLNCHFTAVLTNALLVFIISVISHLLHAIKRVFSSPSNGLTFISACH